MSISFIVLLTSRHNPILHKNEPILPESKNTMVRFMEQLRDLALDMKPMECQDLCWVHSSCPGTVQVFICVQGLVFIK